jgi:alpha-D-ribose 1-methylphosphonate 5-triphosphate synthase subunit PhnG
VLCVKSELHLNQDGVKTGEGIVTPPVRDLFTQIITETGAGVVLTIGTAGSVFDEFQLGDVVVTRAAKFRCRTSSATRPSTTPPTAAAGRSDLPAGHGAVVDGPATPPSWRAAVRAAASRVHPGRAAARPASQRPGHQARTRRAGDARVPPDPDHRLRRLRHHRQSARPRRGGGGEGRRRAWSRRRRPGRPAAVGGGGQHVRPVITGDLPTNSFHLNSPQPGERPLGRSATTPPVALHHRRAGHLGHRHPPPAGRVGQRSLVGQDLVVTKGVSRAG